MENSHRGKLIRILAISGIAIIFFLVFIFSITKESDIRGQVWNMEMTVGDENAKRHYIMYTDLMCPYCDVFSRAVLDNQEEFESFLADNNVLFEIRLTDMLYYGNGSEYSKNSAEATYCAKREGKFWDYYHAALTALNDNYHSKGIGNNSSATPIKNMPEDYWVKIGQKVGLGDSFKQCVEQRETADEVATITEKAMQYSSGMPTFKFGKFSKSGFSDTWGWDEVQIYLKAGL